MTVTPIVGEMATATLKLSASYELESAIASTVELLKSADGYLADRLTRHLDALLDEQLRQVSVRPNEETNL